VLLSPLKGALPWPKAGIHAQNQRDPATQHELGLTNRQIASSLHLSHTCVDAYLRRAAQAGIGWPIPEHFDEDQLRQLLLAHRNTAGIQTLFAPMDEVHRELRRKGCHAPTDLEEYHRTTRRVRTTQFWEYYRRFCANSTPPCGKRTRRASGCLWTGRADDPAGRSSDWPVPTAHLFVAVLGPATIPSPKRLRTPSCRPGSKPMFTPGVLWRRGRG